MQLEFKNVARTASMPDDGRLVSYLKDDNWDDYSIKTLHYLVVFDEKGNKHKIGNVKIGYSGQKTGPRTRIPQSFFELEKKYFSLGQDAEYYQNIKKLDNNLGEAILNGLNDIVNKWAI